MPEMTNSETGETIEVSTEELIEKVNRGQGGIWQVITDADGNQRIVDAYGNLSGKTDGLDRSVNIFIRSDSILPFMLTYMKLENQKEGGEELSESTVNDSDDYKGFVITADCTDQAVTWVLTNTEETLELRSYIRDSQKSNRVEIPSDRRDWKKTDGKLDFRSELSKKDNHLYFAMAFLFMRIYLKEQGLLKQLQELDNRGSGVIMSADSEKETLSANIVCGKNRPDLPCHEMLFGDQMCRPYIDEMLSISRLSSMKPEELEKEGEEGNPDAMEKLAHAFLDGEDGFERSFEKSAYWWEKLAETGSTAAQYNIGLFYAKGCGVSRDFGKAAEWMHKAEANGEEDAAEPAKLYEGALDTLKQAESGDAAAQAQAARLFTQIGVSLKQFGPQQDFKDAFMWAERSAAQGNPEGMYCLALCYAHGRGTEMDREKAAQIYEKSAILGHAPSQWNLAVCFMTGGGKPYDMSEGLYWAYKAASQGNQSAIEGLEAQGRSIPQLIAYYRKPDTLIELSGTQFEGRVVRCEKLRAGDMLTYKTGKDKRDENIIECFLNGGSVGYIPKWEVMALLPLIRLDLIEMKIRVNKCVPKSQRGPRARSAEVVVSIDIKEKMNTEETDDHEKHIISGPDIARKVSDEQFEKMVKEIRLFTPEQRQENGRETVNLIIKEFQSLWGNSAENFVKPLVAFVNYGTQIGCTGLLTVTEERKQEVAGYFRDLKSFRDMVARKDDFFDYKELGNPGYRQLVDIFFCACLEPLKSEYPNLLFRYMLLTALADKENENGISAVRKLREDYLAFAPEKKADHAAEFTGTYDPEAVGRMVKNADENGGVEDKTEEAAKRAEEEAAQKYLEKKKQYEHDYAVWQNKCDGIRFQREKYIEEQLQKAEREIREKALEEYTAEKDRLEKEIAEQEERKSSAERTLSSLGLFKFGEKKKQKSIIDDAGAKVLGLRSDLTRLERELADRWSGALSEARKKLDEMEREAQNQFVFPEEPEKPQELIEHERRQREEEEKRKQEKEMRRREQLLQASRQAGQDTRNRNTELKNQIIVLLSGEKEMTATQVAEAIGCSNLEASSLLTSLVKGGMVNRFVSERKAYFKLTE